MSKAAKRRGDSSDGSPQLREGPAERDVDRLLARKQKDVPRRRGVEDWERRTTRSG